LDTDPFIPPDIVALAQWTAEYYAAGAGETITAVLPPKARGTKASGHRTIRMAAITAAGLEAFQAAAAIADDARPKPAELSAKQLVALTALAGSPGGISTPRLAAQRVSGDTVTRL